MPHCAKCRSDRCHTEHYPDCARAVRARWMLGRRNGFTDRSWLEDTEPQPTVKETNSQFQARMRAAKPVTERGRHT